jgi:hypothetical protein
MTPFSTGGAGKGGDKQGRGTRKVSVLVMAATHNDALTFAKIEILDHVDGEHVQSVLARHVSPKQSMKTKVIGIKYAPTAHNRSEYRPLSSIQYGNLAIKNPPVE